VNELVGCSVFPQGPVPAALPRRFCEVAMKYRDISREEQSVAFVMPEVRLDEMAAELQKALDIMLELEQPSEA